MVTPVEVGSLCIIQGLFVSLIFTPAGFLYIPAVLFLL